MQHFSYLTAIATWLVYLWLYVICNLYLHITSHILEMFWWTAIFSSRSIFDSFDPYFGLASVRNVPVVRMTFLAQWNYVLQIKFVYHTKLTWLCRKTLKNPPTPQVRPHRQFVHHFCLHFVRMRKSSDVIWQRPGVLFLVQDNVNWHNQNMRFKQVKIYQK